MPTAHLSDNDAFVYYEDSGALADARDYTTIVLVHGYSLNSAIFRRLLPHAPAYGLRIFTMNMRDYHGSSTYSAEEVAAMDGPDPALHAAAMRRFGRDIAGFLTYVCTTQGVPPLAIAGGRKTGGVALVTWSLSNIAPLAILGDPDTLDGDSATVLAAYLRTMVLYAPDCPSIVLGEAPQRELHFPLFSAEVPHAQKPTAFAQWVSSHFAPPPPAAAPPRLTADALHACAVLPAQPPTLCALAPDELAATFEPGVIDRSGRILWCAGLPAVLRRCVRRTLLDGGAVLPDVNVVVLWCDQSIWMCVWAAQVLVDTLQEAPVDGGRKRWTDIVRVENANHFIHWEEPERFVRLLNEVI
ncbi:hypothetical protein PHLGIDRAFT_495392 [Phlebiopsis gigantea 11061_1 CR5-6]|uniref:Uncharacterized protein n=1 Tax=Phlebiopsis gigantea (strain 11061_1 CR5-6) TaxID=745531 RepID=A0A0C3S4A6_PHLG1|nr:hypothetical protein PHLGIDRAFT_495392 [Phlebiopsis gigantea 11061_1 CR5-6]